MKQELKYSILLIFANKQDLANTKSIVELAKIYEFDKIIDQEWHIQVIIVINLKACSAKTGEGLAAGLEWLAERVSTKKSTKFPNNPYKISTYNNIEPDLTMRSKTSLGTSQIEKIISNNNIMEEKYIQSEEKLDK